MLFHLLFCFQIALANPGSSEDAVLKELIRALPEKKLTLDFVLSMAMRDSVSFRALEAGKLASESTAMAASAPLDWVVFGTYKWFDSEADVVSAFNPTRSKSRGWSVGARKRFLTGTSFELSYEDSFNQARYSNPIFSVPDYYNDILSFKLSQDLWANFFGIASRSGYQALTRKSEAGRLAYLESIENWSIGLMEQFYAAWMAQRKFQSAKENLERREKLLSVTRIKLKRGTAERPDLLQVDSAHLLAKNALSEAEAELKHIWRTLVVRLKLPEVWLRIPPEKIPIGLHTVPEEAAKICARGVDPSDTLSVKRAQLELEAASLSLEKSRSEHNPKFSLDAVYEVNGINSSAAGARREATGFEHPAWTLGFTLEVPIGLSLAESDLLKARANHTEALAALEISQENKKVEILRSCDYFKRAKEALNDSLTASSQQKQRLDLEERRFSIGRSSTTQVIQAGDDRSNTDQAKDLYEVQVRKHAWEVIQAASGLEPFLERWKR